MAVNTNKGSKVNIYTHIHTYIYKYANTYISGKDSIMLAKDGEHIKECCSHSTCLHTLIAQVPFFEPLTTL